MIATSLFRKSLRHKQREIVLVDGLRNTYWKNTCAIRSLPPGDSRGWIKCKGHTMTCLWCTERRRTYSSNSFANSALKGSAPRPGHFTPEKTPVTIVQEAGWASEPVWTGTENPGRLGLHTGTKLYDIILLWSPINSKNLIIQLWGTVSKSFWSPNHAMHKFFFCSYMLVISLLILTIELCII
jgi:hypothetical protein